MYPKPVLDRIQPSVNHLIAHVTHVDPGLHVPGQGPRADGRGQRPATTWTGRCRPRPVPSPRQPTLEGRRDRRCWRSSTQATPGAGDRPGRRRAWSARAASPGICTQPGTLHIPVEYHTILPELILIGGALVILIVSSLLPKRSRPGLWVDA